MKQILYKLFEHQYLGRDEARTILQNIAQGKYNDVQVASLITVFLMRNISVEELCGFRDALLEMRVPVDLSEFAPIDIVGTGGDGKNTFNISTASCFTVAGAGFPVVKHGNYGATSVSGASNVMEQHGVKFTDDIDQLRRSMEQCNIAYLHAPLFNPALKAVAPVRKGLAVRTFFNMLGPLVNPVLPAYQLLGVYNLPLLRLYTYTYQESKTKFAVVHSLDGYDEIYLGYPNYWGTMPMAVYTFLEHYDFEGKTVHPFCTHEGSGLSGTVRDIQKAAAGAVVTKGLAIHGSDVNDAKGALENWVKEVKR